MISRYQIKEIEDIFSLESRYNYFLKVELAVIKAYVTIGLIPNEDYLKIKEKTKVDVNLINEIEKETKHDVIAFTRSLSTFLGDEKKWVHYNLTSTDVVDTALSLQIKDANKFISEAIDSLLETLKELALKYKMTPIIGRSHGMHAEVTSFGLKFALYYDELKRDKERFIKESSNLTCAKISGTVGNFANIPYEIEGLVAKELGLNKANISTQVLSRDRLMSYTYSLVAIASLIIKIATEIRHLSRSEVREVNEYFAPNQKGSSAMPHKKNPISSENVTGLARYIISSLTMSIMNNDLWHERDISHSSNERIYIPDDISLIIYILRRTNNILSKLEVHEDKMIEDINSDYGVIYSGRVMNFVLSHETKSYSREEIYDAIQVLAFNAYNKHIPLKDLLLEDKLFSSLLTKEELDELFSYSYVFKNVDKIYQAVGILD